MTEAIYLEMSEKTEDAQKAGRRVSVSEMLKLLGVSRSGYRAWLNRFKIHDYKQAYRLIFEYLEAFTTRNEFTVIATLCHQMNSSKYIKEHTLRRSCW